MLLSPTPTSPARHLRTLSVNVFGGEPQPSLAAVDVKSTTVRMWCLSARVGLFAVALAVVVFSAAGCVNGLGEDAGPTRCDTNGDCPGLEICLEGTCGIPGGCTSDLQCPPEQRCIETGRCRANVECLVDDDCCPPGAPCEIRCDDYRCLGSQCTPGDSRDCFIGCHRGSENCVGGTWEACNAPPIEAEVCGDNIDNNCDNRTDEGCAVCTANETRPCSTPCGDGEQACVSGQWAACDAPGDCTCESGETETLDCGTCGLAEATCGTDGTFVVGTCEGEGLCAEGDTEEQPCGNCGVQTRTCGADCGFGAWSACVEPPGACVPSTTQARDCGVGGSQLRICDDQCVWGDYGTCDEQPACTPGENLVQACGMCGTTTSTCNAQGQWGAAGPCVGQGQCAPNSQETNTCGNCGTTTRTCNAQCNWGAPSFCANEGPCAAGDIDTTSCGPGTTQGICQNGEKSRTCQATCQWGGFGSCNGAQYPQTEICGNDIDESCSGSDLNAPDSYEGTSRNNSCATAYDLGTDPNVVLNPTYDSVVNDRDDFFKFLGNDSIGFSESIEIGLSDIPQGADLDIYLYKGQSACESGTWLLSSTNNGPENESISWPETNSGDTDTYYVRVRAYYVASCYDAYRLTIHGLD